MTDQSDQTPPPARTDEEQDRPDAPETSGGDATRDGGGERRRRRGTRGGRGRTRERSRSGAASGGSGDASARDGRTRDDGAGEDAATDAPTTDASSADTSERDARSDGNDVDDGGSSGTRRRRGRRSRGGSSRGGSSRTRPSGDGGSRDDASDSGSDDGSSKAPSKDGSSKGGSSKGGSKDGSSKDGSSKAPSKGASSKDGPSSSGADEGSGRSAEDERTAEAISKGGTRVAAKQKGRRGGGGNGGGGGGRGRSGQRPGGVPEEVRRAILEGPPRTMLVTNREDRTQIGVLEDRTVVEHYVTRKKDVTFVGNIYMARVQNVLPGMEAAFLDIGKGRNGVLYAGEVLYDELDLEEGADERIENALKPGQTVLVQVTKDPMGSKGPRLTMHLSLAGRYSVLAPSSDLFGISRKLTDKERDRLRRIVKKVKPDHHGVIVRTAAENASEEQITADLERLLAKWARVEEAAADAKALTSVYEEPPLVVKVIRDNFGPEFERCVVDDEDLYHQVRGYLDEVAPELTVKVELYGQPTADARARAAGAPALEEASADPATADAAAVVTEPSSGGAATSQDRDADGSAGPDNDDTAKAEARSAEDDADASATDRWDTEGGADGDAPTVAGPAPGTASSADAGASPVDAAAHEAVVATTVDLEAARERRDTLPQLFEAYDVTDQLRKATSRKVWLPSGGYLIIEPTEAMKVIDVNSGKFTGSGDMNLEEVVLRTNLEAADEIVRQLRLRDMGGIIVIDFIDMLLKANQDQVVRRLKRELLRDRTKTRVSEVSRLGLVQMTRKNVSQGLVEAFSHTCEHCEGRGLISELD